MRQRRPDLYADNPDPCPRCLKFMGQIGLKQEHDTGINEMIQPVPRLAPALARDGSGACCPDCQAADTLHQVMNPEPEYTELDEWAVAAEEGFCPVPFTEPCKAERIGPNRSLGVTWRMARIAVGNDRRDQLRAPGLPMGLVSNGMMPASAPGDLELHWAWLKENGLGWGEEEE